MEEITKAWELFDTGAYEESELLYEQCLEQSTPKTLQSIYGVNLCKECIGEIRRGQGIWRKVD